MQDTDRRRQLPAWGRVAIGVCSAAIAAYGGLAIVIQHHVGRTRRNQLVESAGAVAVGMGLFYVGGAILMASLALPASLRKPAIAVGGVVMVCGAAVAVWVSNG